jgi:hypothetical protein
MRKSEPALLRSLEKALHEVTPSHLPKEGVSFSEWARQFTYEYGPLIEQIAEFQLRTQFDPEIQALSAASTEVGTVGPDGKIDPRVLGMVERITQNPHYAALSQASESYGVRGIGLLTLNVEVALLLGIQVGGELVLMHPYSVGDYTVPSELIGRAWYQVTAGADIGISGTIAPYPLDISCWFTAPVNTKHLVSAYITYIPLSTVYPLGLRLEIFGWLPEDSAPAIDPSKFIDHIHGFRVVVEAGYHKGVGVGVLGHQVATSGGLQLATLSITPNNLQPGLKYTLNGTVSAPHSGGQPNRIFRASTTLKLTFPKWVFSATSQLPVVAFTNDGTGATTGWKATSTPGEGDGSSVFGFTWVGKDNAAWTQNMKFSVGAYSNDAAPQDGNVACTLDNLDSADSAVERSLSGTQMTLSPLVFTAVGNYDLKVDPRCNSIENQPSGTPEMTGAVNATTANSASNKNNNFYPIVDPTDQTKCLTIDDMKGNSWWCGYQYRQATDTDDVCAQYRAVFWKTNTVAADFNYFAGTWQSLINNNTDHSIAVWSNGASTKGTTLDFFLKPTS